MFKRIITGIGAVAVVTAGSLMLLAGNTARADDTVTIEQFNNLTQRVETLESQLETSSETITTLTSELTEAKKTIQTLSGTVGNHSTSLNTLITKTDNNLHKIDNITAWQIKLSELTRWNISLGAFATLENFRKSQQ